MRFHTQPIMIKRKEIIVLDTGFCNKKHFQIFFPENINIRQRRFVTKSCNSFFFFIVTTILKN